jgi:cytoskeletal protein CcmA (bactofilin family)
LEKPPIEPSDEAIRLRSQQIWEREGCPEGCSQEHWNRAKAELEAEQEHWTRAKAELEAQMEKTSNTHLAASIRRKGDLVRSFLVQARAMMPKASRPASRSASDHSVLARPRPLTLARVKRARHTTAAPSIICADIVHHGALDSAGDIHLDGRVEGKVHCAGLVVGDVGAIEGEVIADDVFVRGRIRGSIRARKVHLCSGARVEGDILFGVFVAEAGAQFEGYCRHVDDPLAQENADAPAATGGPVVPEDAPEDDTLSQEAPRSQTAA